VSANAKIRVAILSAAHLHADSYARVLGGREDAELVCLWDDDPARGQAKAEEYHTRYEPDLERALGACDGVVICAENSRHRELALAAASAGVHVLCEKPLATSPGDAREMVDSCRRAGVLLGTAFPVRHATASFELRAALEGGKLGELVSIRGTNRGTMPGGWFVRPELSGGGAVTDHTVHVVDLVRFVTGREFESVYAEADTRFYEDLGVEDCGLLVMRLEGGVVVSLDPSWSRPNKAFPTWGDVTLQVVGTEGIADFNYTAQHSKFYSNSRVRAAELPWGEDGDALMIEDFLAAIREGRPPLASGEDGLRAVEVVHAAYEAIRSGQVSKVQHV